MKDDQKQESDDDDLDDLIRELVLLLDDLGEDLNMMLALQEILSAE